VHASVVVPGHSPAVAAAGRAPSEVVVNDDDDDDDGCYGPIAAPCRSPLAPRASRASV
jgi:hypothetical protein